MYHVNKDERTGSFSTCTQFEIVENEEYIFHCNTLKIRNGIIIFYSNEYRDIPEGTMTYFNKINDFYMQCTIDQLKAAGDY